ncbi:hypothetical protein THAOC_14385, partial [Thalassiosira oceanica]
RRVHFKGRGRCGLGALDRHRVLPASMEPDAIAPRRIDHVPPSLRRESKDVKRILIECRGRSGLGSLDRHFEYHPFSMEPDARRIDQSRHLSHGEPMGRKEDFASKATTVGADWDLWTEASSYPLSILQDDSRTVGEESTCSILTEYLADGEEGPDESDRRDLPSDGPSLGRQTREVTKVSFASEIEPGQYLVRAKSSLIVKTQLESLALRMSFRSQLRLGICQKSVRFDKLSIREYPIVIGDSPSTSRGVPLSIGWEYEPESTVDVDTYETTRDIGGVCERRSKSELRVPSNVREEMLGRAGFSKKDMRDAAEKLMAEKLARRSSLRTYGRMKKFDPLLRRVMDFHGKLKKAMLFSKQSSETRMLYSERHDPLNVSIGKRGSLMSTDTLIFIDLTVDTLH